MPCPRKESWKTCAVPWNPVVIVAGRRSSRSSLVMASTACPSEKPGARLNEIVGSHAIVGLRLENDLIVIDRAVNSRHLPRTEGVVQLLANLIDGDAIN